MSEVYLEPADTGLCVWERGGEHSASHCKESPKGMGWLQSVAIRDHWEGVFTCKKQLQGITEGERIVTTDSC